MIYVNDFGREFRFNDIVECTATLAPREDAVGRLVQVRRKVGQFGSDVYLIRRGSGTLATFENVGLQPAIDAIPVHEGDSPETEYSIREEFPEIGFVVEEPRQPASESPAFGIAITKG